MSEKSHIGLKTKTRKAQIFDALSWECIVAPTNPNMEQDSKYPMAHWYIVVSNKADQHMNFHYSMGSGLCEQWLKKQAHGRASHYSHQLKDDPGARFLPKAMVKYAQEWGMRPSNTDMALCFCNIALDAEPSFREFCNDFGYLDDSIKAHKTWETCLKQQQDLMNIFPQSIEWWAEAREEIDQ